MDPGHRAPTPATFFMSATCRLSNIRQSPSTAEPPPERSLRSCKRKEIYIAELRSTIRVARPMLAMFLT